LKLATLRVASGMKATFAHGMRVLSGEATGA